MKGLSYCDTCGTLIIQKRDKQGQLRAWCSKCGFVDQEIDRSSYTLSSKQQDHIKDWKKTTVIDRRKKIKELEKEYGKKTHGWACPKCKSLYLTRKKVITRGDEAGKTFTYCLSCGHVFRRAIFIKSKEK